MALGVSLNIKRSDVDGALDFMRVSKLQVLPGMIDVPEDFL
jgi:hypothetical protein